MRHNGQPDAFNTRRRLAAGLVYAAAGGSARVRVPLLVLLLLAVPSVLAAPEQVRLGIPTSDPSTTMSVSWLEVGPPREATVILDTPDGPKTIPAERKLGPSVGVVYEATLSGLSPATNYTYRVEDKSFSFQTPSAGEFTFIALGDMGVTPEAVVTLKAVQKAAPAFILHSGDISYGEGNPQTWATWFNLVEPVAASRPWITAVGNHETAFGGARESMTGTTLVNPAELAFYQQRFALPGNELWYSFNWNGAHFVALDTYSEPNIPAGEAAWLAADLAAHANATWKIVFLHEPPFSSNRHGSSERVQEAFVPIFESHGVDLVIAAHDHGYERFEKRNNVTYLVSGGAGVSLYDAWRSPLENGSAAHSASYHYTQIRVTETTLEASYVGTGGDSFADNFTLTKPARTPSEPPAPAAALPTPGLGVLAIVLVLSVFGLLRAERGR